MDNKGACGNLKENLKEKKMIDTSIIWQWRIMHAKKYIKGPDAFYHCNKIGLDFNVGSNSEKKMDLKLLSNGVMLEICDFARTIYKGKDHFLPNFLENKFDLQLKNEQLFTIRLRYKVASLIKKTPKDKQKLFPLLDTLSNPEITSNGRNGLSMTSTDCKTKGLLMEVDTAYDSEQEEISKLSPVPSKKYRKTESLSEDIDGSHATDTEQENEFKSSDSTEVMRDVLPSSSYLCCEEIGLTLDAGSKQSLDPHLLTVGVMLELLHLRRAVTATRSCIVLALLEHNFGLNIKTKQAKSQLWFKILNFLKRVVAKGTKKSQEFKEKPFSFEIDPNKVHRKMPTNALSSIVPLYQFKEVTKRRQSDLKSKQAKRAQKTISRYVTNSYRSGQSEQMETDRHQSGLCVHQTLIDHGYTCPQGESDIESDIATNSGNASNQGHSQNSTSCSLLRPDIHGKQESSYLSTNLTNTDSSSLPIVSTNVNPVFESYRDKREPCAGEEQPQGQRNITDKCNVEEEQIETENNMWKLRANRVRQILTTLNRSFSRSKLVGLKFNVGFDPKQNLSFEHLNKSVLLEVAQFALAMNSSQQDFIMEILEYNFDLNLQSNDLRNTFEHEIMTAVRQLKVCEDAVRFSKEVFELPVTSSVNRVPSSISPPDSHAVTKKHISQQSENHHPFCKEIGLRLHVNNHRPTVKLDVRKLTKGAMTELTDFAEQLCGTFEEICFDIFRHNFDCDSQSGCPNLAGDLLVQISLAKDQMNQSNCVKRKQWKRLKTDSSVVAKLDCQNNPGLDGYTTGSSKLPATDQNVGSFIDIDLQNENNKYLWKLRANHVQHIFSVPHEEHCPLYSYSRCKKLGMDFNLGSGVKQNLDPNLLTNGVMVEVYTFATALQSARRNFITDILEYNFNLNLKNEQQRVIFAQKIDKKIKALNAGGKATVFRRKMPFELPDLSSIGESDYAQATLCPKCYQDRNYKLHPNAMTDSGSASSNCLAQKLSNDPSHTFSTMEETIMQSYPNSKKIGLSLCVNVDQPKDKLSTHVLTLGIINEVTNFAQTLCGMSKYKVINEILEHNFSFDFQSRDFSPAQQFYKMLAQNDKGLAWYSKTFVVQPCPPRDPEDPGKRKEVCAMQQMERKETTKKRKLALQTKKERTTLLSENIYVKTREPFFERTISFPICKQIGLDLDVTSKSADKEKLDLKLLTRAVVYEIHTFAHKKALHSYPQTVFDILDYNFDLSSQHHRGWEFSIATTSKIKTMINQYKRNLNRVHEVFELPFVFDPKAPQSYIEDRQNRKSSTLLEEPIKKTNEQGRYVRQMRYCPDINRIRFLDNFKIEEPWLDEDTSDSESSTASEDSDSHAQGSTQIKVGEYDSSCGNKKPEPDTEQHHPHVKAVSNTEDMECLVSSDSAKSPENTSPVCPNSESNIGTEVDTEDVQYYILTEQEGSEGYTMLTVCPNTESSFKLESDREDVEYLVTVEEEGSPEYTLLTTYQDTENELIIEQQENVPADLYIQLMSNLNQGVVSYTEN